MFARLLCTASMLLSASPSRRRIAALDNYTTSLVYLKRLEEAKVLLRKAMPVARRALGSGDRITLSLRWTYAQTFYRNGGASLDEVREAVATLEDVERTARRIFGDSYPFVLEIESELRFVRSALRRCERLPNV